MNVTELSKGNWAVVDDGTVVRWGFESNADAYANSDEGRAETDRYNRIRGTFSER